jgi:ATP-dependent DNA helicase RecQ
LSETARPRATFLAQCLSIDIEVDPRTARVFDLAAVPGDGGPAIRGGRGQVDAALDQVEARMGKAGLFASRLFAPRQAQIRHLIGHNILRHDLPHLAALRPRLAQAADAPIDTLWLNPLAFPRNPYHHLVKHYHDGRLLAGHVNDSVA